jgi:inosine/xanthosine triphosphatase
MPLDGISVGTANAGKIQAVRRALAKYPLLARLEVLPQKVASGVSDQPSTLEETTRGAGRRARAAAACGGTVLGIGMESGLFDVGDDKTFDVCACVIYDGVASHIGYSCAWELPPRVQRLVKESGMNLTDACNEAGICDDPNIGDKGGVLAVVTGGRVTRPDYTVQAIQMAIVAMNPSLYECGPAVPGSINDPLPRLGSTPRFRALVLGGAMWALAAACFAWLVPWLADRNQSFR